MIEIPHAPTQYSSLRLRSRSRSRSRLSIISPGLCFPLGNFLAIFFLINMHTPRMLHHRLNPNSPLDIPIQHLPNEVQIFVTHNVRYAKVVVHDLVDAVEGVLFVHDGVEEDAEGPDVLFFAAVG